MAELNNDLEELEKRVQQLESRREPIINAPSDIIWFLLLLFVFFTRGF